jgi:hypothetical protein
MDEQMALMKSLKGGANEEKSKIPQLQVERSKIFEQLNELKLEISSIK